MPNLKIEHENRARTTYDHATLHFLENFHQGFSKQYTCVN